LLMREADDNLRRIRAQQLLLRALIGRLVLAGTLQPADVEGIVAWAERLAGEDNRVRQEVRKIDLGREVKGSR
jgi:hypothetical protein